MKKRLMSIVLALVMLVSTVPIPAMAQSAPADLGQVRVVVENNTCPLNEEHCWKEGATPWEGVLVDEMVPLTAESTMMSCVVEALGDYQQVGAEQNYISEIHGLQAADRGGWVGTLNDWFTNEGFGAFTVAAGKLRGGDEIRMMYTMDWGADCGSIPNDTTKTLRQVDFTGAALVGKFRAEQHEYQLALEEGSAAVTVAPQAYNKNFQVRIYKGGTYDGADEGFWRGQEIAVKAGDELTVVVGDPQWPSMNNGAYGGAEKVPAGVYRFHVVEAGSQAEGGFESFFKGLEGVAAVENHRDYPLAVSEDGTALVSTNAGVNSSSSGLTLTFQKAAKLRFDYQTSCESKWDFLRITHNDRVLNGTSSEKEKFSGEMTEFKTYSLTVDAGDTVKVEYYKDGSGQKGQDRAFLKNFAAELPFAVTFHANDGTEATRHQGIFGTANLAENTFVREGYRFEGWSKTPQGGVDYADGAEMTLSGNLDLYAVWTAVWAVTFPGMPEGAAVSVKQGGQIVEPREDGSYLLADGQYTYSAECFGYESAVDVGFTVRGGAVAVAEGLVKLPTYKVVFHITPFEAAEIAQVELVNGQGTVMETVEGAYQLPKGSYEYTVRAKGFQKVTGTVTVDNLMVTVPVAMEISHTWEGDIAQEAPRLEDSVYCIGSGAELAWFAQQVNEGQNISGKLVGDIELNVPEEEPVNIWTPIGTSAKPFMGSFSGAGHTVSGLSIQEGSYIGLFGVIGDKGRVDEVKLTGTQLKGTEYIGALAGENRGVVSGVSVSDSVISGERTMGGIVGRNFGAESRMAACINESGAVHQLVNKDTGIGGVVGENAGTVELCANHAELLRDSTSNDGYYGGIAGRNNGVVVNCYNTGKIPSCYKPGGIVGAMGYGECRVENCYNTGTVVKGGTKAIRGDSGGAVVNCYYLDSCGATESGATALSEQKMKAAAERLGGAFQSDLAVAVNGGFPILKWQNPEATYSITLRVTPAQAQVVVRQGERVIAPASQSEGVYTFTELKGGEYSYEVSLESQDYIPQSGTVVLGRADVELNLALEIRKYDVTVTVTPEDAAFTLADPAGESVEGQREGGVIRYQLPGGTYKYTAEKFGFVTGSGSIVVGKEAVEQQVALERSESHQLTVSGLPEGVTLALSHAEGGVMRPDEEGNYLLVDGSYTYTVSGDGYANGKGVVEMAGEDQALVLEMQPLTAWNGADVTAFVVGHGTKDDPYVISSPAELAYLSQVIAGENSSQFGSKYYRVSNDLDMGGKAFTPIGESYSKDFDGQFDGGDHVISRLTVNAPKGYGGLFGYLGGGKVHHVVLKDVTVSGEGSALGTLAGYGAYGTVENCAVIGASVHCPEGSNVGGFIGEGSGITIRGCYAVADVVGKTSVGGLLGTETESTVKESFVRGSVTGSGAFVGGLVGSNGNEYDGWDDMTGTYTAVYTDVAVRGQSTYGAVFGSFDASCNLLDRVFFNADAVCTGSGGAVTDNKLVGKPLAEMKSDEFVGLLNGSGQAFERFQTELSYVNDGLPYPKNTYHETVELERLSAPVGLAWSGKTAQWTAVEGASGYEVVLYRGEDEIDRVRVETERCDLSGQIGLGGSGSYAFTVAALGDGEQFAPSLASEKSAVAEFTVSGAQITFQVTARSGSFREGDPKIVVTVNGVEQELVNGQAAFLPEGSHSYTITADTFKTQTGTVVVGSEAQTVEAALAFDPVWNGTLSVEPQQVQGVYQITNGYELAWFRDKVNESTNAGRSAKLDAVLTGDVDLGGHEWVPISPMKSTSATCGYTGTFDGAGHSVQGLMIDGTEKASALFGYVYTGGVIRNLTVEGSITGGQYAAGIAALLAGGHMEGCVNKANVSAGDDNFAGGVTAYMTNYTDKSARISACANEGSVSGGGMVGGIVGSASNGVEIVGCRNGGSVRGARDSVGGIAGTSSLPITGCVNRGAVTSSAGRVGGVAGFVNKPVADCYNTGAVSGVSREQNGYGVGGVVGQLHSDYGGMLTNAYNTGSVTDLGSANIIGAVVGSKGQKGSAVRNGWYDEKSCAQGIGFGAVEGDSAVGCKAEALESLEMAAYLGGSFVSPAQGGAPVLRWEDRTARVVTAFAVNQENATVRVTRQGESGEIPAADGFAWVLADGVYDYTVSCQGYDSVSGSVTVDGKSQLVVVELQQQTFPVTFAVTPEDAKITVFDEQSFAVLPGEDGYRLGAGSYTYRVEKFGYEAQSGSFTVVNEAVEIPAITLEKAAVYPVTLEIAYGGEVPEDAVMTVRCGGEVVGQTASLELPDGQYTYEIIASGYFTAKGSFAVEGQAVRVPVSVELRTTWDGSVSEAQLVDGVYQITGAEELAWFAQQVNAGQTAINGKLLANIYVNDESSSNRWTPIGDYASQYAGTFDGNGKRVVGLDAPLFGYGGEGGLIKRVTVEGAVDGSSNRGGICTATYGGIENCVNKAAVSATGQRVGGIVGVVYSTGHVTNCLNEGAVSSSYVGSEFAEGGTAYLGGVVGYSYGSVKGCANYGEVKAAGANYGGIGGVLGVAGNTVEECYNLGKVSGDRRTGGIVGIADQSGCAVRDSYNAGTVCCTGTTVNPFCGAVAGDIANSDGATVGVVTNTYYLDGSYRYEAHTEGIGYGVGEATAMSQEAMKGEDFVRSLGQAFHVDDLQTQNGWPVLAWQGGRVPEASADEKAVAADKLALQVEPLLVKEAMTIALAKSGAQGSAISWKSDNTDIITDAGVVTLPREGVVTVHLTATIAKGLASDTRSFAVQVQSAAVTDQQKLDQVVELLGAVHLVPVYGEDTSIQSVLADVVDAKLEGSDLGVSAQDIQVVLTRPGVNNNHQDKVSHIGEDGTITYYYMDPAKDTMHGAPMKEIGFRLEYQGASAEVEASAFIPWDRALVKAEMQKIADALTFDVIRGENGDVNAVTSDLTLPVQLEGYGWSMIGWSSDHRAIQVRTGTPLEPCVGKVYPEETDTPVQLSAVITFNKTSDNEPAITLHKDLTVTVQGAASRIEEELGAALDKYTLEGLTDSVSGEKIDPKAVSGDVLLLKPRDLDIDGGKIRVEVTASSDAAVINGYKANIYRPLPGEDSASVTLTVKLTHKETGRFVEKELGTLTILPLEQQAIDAELALMEQVKASFFEGIRGENTRADAVTADLHAFQEVYEKDGQLVWVYDRSDRTYTGIRPADIPKEGYDESYNLFHSSKPAIIQHENLLVRPGERNEEVVITANLTSQLFERYAQRYPNNAQLQRLANQKVEQRVVVLGVGEDQVKANEVRDLIGAIGKVELDKKGEIEKAQQAFENLTKAQQAMVDNQGDLTAAVAELARLEQARDMAAAQAVEEMIGAIGKVSLDKKDAIQSARKAFEELTEPQQKLVGNVEVLVKAEEELEKMESDQAEAGKVDAMIEAIEEVTVEREQELLAAQAAYAQLSDDQKAFVTRKGQLDGKMDQLKALLRPSAVVEVQRSTGKPVLNWNQVEGAVRYEVWRSVDDGGMELLLTTEGTRMVNGSAKAGERCTYQVRSITEAGTVGQFSTAVAITCGERTLAAPVTELVSKASNGKPYLTWEQVEGAVKYEVYRKEGKDGSYERLLTTSGTRMTNTSAEVGVTYYYKVRAVAADGGRSLYSAVKHRTCDCARPVVDVTVRVSDGKPILTWKQVEGAVQYEVYRSVDGGKYEKFFTTAGTRVVNGSAQAGHIYRYKVKTICENQYANSAFGQSGKIRVEAGELAAPVTKLTNKASNGKPYLTWNQVDGAVKYEVWRREGKNDAYERLLTTSGTKMTNTSARPGVTYDYKVRAVAEDGGKSAFSAVKHRTCDCARPVVSASVVDGKPVLTWEKVEGAVQYEVYRAEKNGGFERIFITEGTRMRNGSAKAGHTYRYKVVAVCANRDGSSAQSAVVSVKAR